MLVTSPPAKPDDIIINISVAAHPVCRPQAFQHPPASLEGPSVGLADNLTAVTAQLRERKDEVSVWTEQLRKEIGQIRSSAEELLQTPG